MAGMGGCRQAAFGQRHAKADVNAIANDQPWLFVGWQDPDPLARITEYCGLGDETGIADQRN